MSSYELRVDPSAQRAITRLPEGVAFAVVAFVGGPLLANPQRVGKPLRMDLEGRWAARVGVYRIVYSIREDEGAVRVQRIEHRADVYRPR